VVDRVLQRAHDVVGVDELVAGIEAEDHRHERHRQQARV
jgi:hypothetical protein